MPQSLVQIYVHIVFSTKNRMPFLSDDDLRDRTYRYLAGIFNSLDSPAVIIGGVEDHVHILCRLGKTIAVADLARNVKRDSSKWIKDQSRQLDFHWQRGYGAFSISPSHVPAITEYIRNQREHHRTETFQDEFRRICRKHGIDIDERYVWD
jgi:REP-associated tyrosine transposase